MSIFSSRYLIAVIMENLKRMTNSSKLWFHLISHHKRNNKKISKLLIRVIMTKTRTISQMIKKIKIIRKRTKRRTIKVKVNRMKMVNKFRIRKILMRVDQVIQVTHPMIKTRSQRPWTLNQV